MRPTFSALILITAAWIGGAADAWAHDVLVFLDRSPAGRSEEAAARALRLAQVASRAGHRVRVFVQGQSARGHQARELNLARDGGGFREPIDRFDALYQTSPDPRAALRQSVLIKKGKPLWVFFVGPFDASSDPIPSERTTLSLARQRWNRAAPPGSHVAALGMAPSGRARLDEGDGPLRGRVAHGHLILGVETPLTARPDPRPAFGTAAALTAQLETKLRWMPLGSPKTRLLDAVTASSDVASDAIEATPPTEPGMLQYRLTRRASDATVATIKLERVKRADVLWLDPTLPRPISFEWNAVRQGVRLLGDTTDKVGVFEVKQRAALPARRTYRLQHVGLTEPVWDVRFQSAGSVPYTEDVGLQVELSPGSPTEDGLVEHAVRVSLSKAPVRALKISGRCMIRAKDTPHEVSFFFGIDLPGGVIVIEKASDFPDAIRLPMISHGLRLRVKSSEPGVQAEGTVLVQAVPESLNEKLQLERPPTAGKRQVAQLGTPIPVRSGDQLAWRVGLRPGLSPADLADGAGVLRIQGGENTFELQLGVRRPHFEVHEGEGAHYIVNRDGMTAANPVVVKLDPDGTSGAYLESFIREGPTVDVDPKGIQAFEVRRVNEPDTWHVMPVGPWKGVQPETFDEKEQILQIRINDAAGTTIGTQTLHVTISPRWGSRGWILVGLAALTALLGFATLWHLRPHPLKGTLLYTADGLRQTVGKLDLARLGRKKGRLHADANGRLSFSKGVAIARLIPTRVGGMLEFPRDGGTVEKRMLVDGMSVRVGEHVLRYVSGENPTPQVDAPTQERPDLLGPEFDMPTGHVDEAYKQAKKEWRS